LRVREPGCQAWFPHATATAANHKRLAPPRSRSTRGPKHALAVFAVIAATFLSGRGDSDSPASPGVPNAAEETALGHVHGLGVDPGDDLLYVASHFGVFRVAEDGTRERVADRWQDTMGFAIVGPGT
jgi:hypothetical protein